MSPEPAKKPEIDPAKLKSLVDEIHSPDRQQAARAFNELSELIAKRLRGIVGGRVGDHAEDVCQDTLLRLWKSKPAWNPERGAAGFFAYLRSAAESATVDHIRRDSNQPQIEPRKGDIEHLFEITGGGGIAPNQLLVAAYRYLLDYPLERIAKDLADRPMGELAAHLQETYKGTATFEGLMAGLSGGAANQTLNDFLKRRNDGVQLKAPAEKQFQAWIRRVQDAAADWVNPKPQQEAVAPGPRGAVPAKVALETYRETLRLTKAPHKLIVFILNQFLDWSPTEIDAKATLPLGRLCAEARRGCASIPMRTVAVPWLEYFHELEAAMRVAGDKTLKDYSPCVRAAVDGWVRSVRDQFETVVHAQERNYLTDFFQINKPHHSISCGLGDFVGMSPEDIWPQSNTALDNLASTLESEYRKRWIPSDDDAVAVFRVLTTELSRPGMPRMPDERRKQALQSRVRQMRDDGNGSRLTETPEVGDTCFNDYYLRDGKAERLDEIREWKRQTRSFVRKAIEKRGSGLLIAYIYGWLFQEDE